MEFHLVYTRFFGIVVEIEFRLILPFHIEIGVRIDRFFDIGKPRALLSRGIRVAVFVSRDRGGAHHQTVGHFRHVVSGKFGILFLHVLAYENGSARHVGARHGSAGIGIVAAADGGINVTAVRRDVGAQFEVRFRPPRREAGHKRTREIFLGKHERARFFIFEIFARVHLYGARGKRHLTYGHRDRTGDVVVNDRRHRAFDLRDSDLILERVAAAADYRDFSFHVDIRIVADFADPGNDYVFKRFFFRVSEELRHEIFFLSVQKRTVFKIDRLFAVRHEITRLHAADRSHGHGSVVRCGRAHRHRIGIGSKVRVAVRRALRRRIRVAGSHQKADARRFDGIVNFRGVIFVGSARKAAGRAERHIDRVYAEQNRVLQRGEQRILRSACVFVSERFENRKLRLRGNARDRVVFARDDPRNVRAVIVHGVYVGVVVGIIVSVRHFFG